MKAKFERVLDEFMDYCKRRFDVETIRHYKANMGRLHSYIYGQTTRCKQYHNKYYLEQKKPHDKRDYSWMEDYRRIRYIEEFI